MCFSALLVSNFCIIVILASCVFCLTFFFFFQAEDGIRDTSVTGVQTCALPICCVFGQGYWKTHPEAWPVTELQLGNTTYTQDQLLAILREPVRGNGILILAKQEIAAKLNIANGADGSCIQQTLADADALIGDLVIPPIGDGYLRPRDVSPTAGILGNYNEGG